MAKQPTLKQLSQRAARAEEAVQTARANLVKAVISRLQEVGNTKHRKVLGSARFRLALADLRNLASGEYGLLLTQDPWCGGYRLDKDPVESKRFEKVAINIFRRRSEVGAVELLTVNGRQRLRCDQWQMDMAISRAIRTGRTKK